MNNGIPLSQLDARIHTYKFYAQRFDAIVMECPLEGCDHSILIPFSDKGGRTPHGEVVWKRISGSTVEDITLQPSYRLTGGCKLHGWVRDGRWYGV